MSLREAPAEDGLSAAQRILATQIRRALEPVLTPGLNQDLTLFIRGGEITSVEFQGRTILGRNGMKT